MFTPGITILVVSTGIVMGGFLAVGCLMAVVLARMMRPVEFTGIGGMRVKLVELITVRGAVLGRRGKEELTKFSLLLRLLLAGGKRRGW